MSIWATFTLFLTDIGADRTIIPGVKILNLIGIIYAINPLAQFFFMLVIDKVKPRISLSLGYVFSSVVFLGYVAVAVLGKTGIIANPYLMIPLQLLLAFTCAALYLGSLLYLNTGCSEVRCTVSSPLNAVTGLCGIARSLLGGLLSSITWNVTIGGKPVVLSYEISILVAAGMALLGFLVVLIGEKNLFPKSTQNTSEYN